LRRAAEGPILSVALAAKIDRWRRPYYGWVIAGTLAVTETVSWGVLYYAFSVFLVPMQRDLGWSAATLTGAYSLALLVSGLAAPFVGRWLDTRGPRALMTAGSVLGTLLVVAWSRVDSLLGYYLIWAGIGLALSTTLYEPAFAAVTAWFDRDRARAVLAITLLAGFASTIFLPLSGWLVAELAWRRALLVLAGVLAALTSCAGDRKTSVCGPMAARRRRLRPRPRRSPRRWGWRRGRRCGRRPSGG
jgi:MFS family permease